MAQDIDIDLDAQVEALRPDQFVDEMSVRVRPRDPEPAHQQPVAALQDEVTFALESVREEMRALVEALEPVLTPRIEEEAQPAKAAEGPRSKMAASLASWRDEMLTIAADVRDVAGRVEL